MSKMDQFRSFLLNETKHYLGQRAGDILTALQNLHEDAASMGSRALIRAATGIVNQIRRILRGRWEEADVQYLKQLQKIGVAIMKSIDENDDIQAVIASAVSEMEGMLDKLQVPLNSLGSEGGGNPEGPTPPQEGGGDEDEPLTRGSQFGM